MASVKNHLKGWLYKFTYWAMCHFPSFPPVRWIESRLRQENGEPVRWRCWDCGRVYGNKGWIDVIIPDEQWVAIGMPEDGGGLLCGACIIKRGEKLPNITHARLEFRDD